MISKRFIPYFIIFAIVGAIFYYLYIEYGFIPERERWWSESSIEHRTPRETEYTIWGWIRSTVLFSALFTPFWLLINPKGKDKSQD